MTGEGKNRDGSSWHPPKVYPFWLAPRLLRWLPYYYWNLCCWWHPNNYSRSYSSLLLASSVFKRSPLLLLESVAGIPASVPMLASMLWFVSFLFLLQYYLYALFICRFCCYWHPLWSCRHCRYFPSNCYQHGDKQLALVCHLLNFNNFNSKEIFSFDKHNMKYG